MQVILLQRRKCFGVFNCKNTMFQKMVSSVRLLQIQFWYRKHNCERQIQAVHSVLILGSNKSIFFFNFYLQIFSKNGFSSVSCRMMNHSKLVLTITCARIVRRLCKVDTVWSCTFEHTPEKNHIDAPFANTVLRRKIIVKDTF